MAEKQSAKQNLSIVIVEDNAHLRDSWATIIDFEKQLKVTGRFDSVEDALKARELGRADVVLLDIELPGMSGVDGVTEIHKVNPSASIIMATVHEDESNIFEALQNGAVGYLSKRVSTTELIDAIHEVVRGGSPMTPSVARKVIDWFRAAPATADKEDSLNERELEILNLLAEGKSYNAIGKEVALSFDGVSYHARNIYRKLQVKNRGEAVREGFRRKLIRFFK